MDDMPVEISIDPFVGNMKDVGQQQNRKSLELFGSIYGQVGALDIDSHWNPSWSTETMNGCSRGISCRGPDQNRKTLQDARHAGPRDIFAVGVRLALRRFAFGPAGGWVCNPSRKKNKNF